MKLSNLPIFSVTPISSSSYSFDIQMHSIQGSRLLDVHAVDAHEGIGDKLPAVGVDGIAEGLGNDVNVHAGLQTDAVGVDAAFYGDSV